MINESNLLLNREELRQLPREKLVEIIIEQQKQINQLEKEIERVKVSLNLALFCQSWKRMTKDKRTQSLFGQTFKR